MGPVAHVSIRCLTSGVRIADQVLRAGQDIELDADDDQVTQLRIMVAAGDIAAAGLPEITVAAKLSSKGVTTGKLATSDE